MITKVSDFIGEIYLSQVGVNASSQVNNNERLEQFINKYEPEILVKALGRQLYNEFKANLNEDGTVKDESDQKWKNLLSGAEYEKDGSTYYWKGLRTDAECLMAYHVYYNYVIADITQQTTLGTIKTEAKNASSASVIPTTTNAWRILYDWYMGEYSIEPVRYVKRGVCVEDWYLANSSQEVSLHRFLLDNEYDNWHFTPIENKNSWGL